MRRHALVMVLGLFACQQEDKTGNDAPVDDPATTSSSSRPASQPGSQPSSQPSSLPANHAAFTDTATRAGTLAELEGLFAMPTDIGPAIAMVNERAITGDQLEAKLRALELQITAAGLPENITRAEILKAAVDQLVEAEIQKILAAQLKVEVPPDAIEAWLADLHTRMEASPSFKAFLCRAGKCEEATQRRDALDALTKDGIMTELRNRGRAEIREASRAYYDRHESDFLDREAIEVWRILVRAPGTMVQRDRDIAKARAETVHKSAVKSKRDPKRFEDLAKSHSASGRGPQGGYLGWVPRTTFPKDLEDQLWRAKPNSILPLFQDGEGYWIYRVGRARPERQRPFAEVEAQIVEQIYAPILTKKLEAEVERLKSQQKIRVLVPELAQASK
ncbi:MAG: peptidyl-prolyl cis-trans isomerase [Deltaproteobacteria bacterium]|nr:peptidyl-prolyl cis-trans isomerase [Deltaproteobacteria bacterium]